MAMLEKIINYLNGLLWGELLVYGLVGAGLYFTIRLGFIQFSQFGHGLKLLAISRRPGKNGLSSFQVFCTSMAARVGAGNMAGVAFAIGVAGPGAVFLDVGYCCFRHGHSDDRIHTCSSL
jgi:AGCS family alanine or glycine:cation symporter